MLDRFFSQISSQKGFVLLFSFVISVLIALIVGGMFKTALRENILSSTARESAYALYAADSAMDCILFHAYVEDHQSDIVNCDGQQLQKIPVSGYPDVYDLKVPFRGDRFECASISVNKQDWREYDAGDGQGLVNTQGTHIIARGYNLCDETGNPDVSSNLLLERRLEAWFPQNLTPATPPTATPITP